LSGREGLGLSLSPAELVSAGFRRFGNLKCLFSTTPEVGKETEANGGHRGDRTRSWYDRTRPVSTAQTRVLGFVTDASGHSRDRCIRSVTQRNLQFARTIGRAVRPVTHDRTRPIVEGAYWTQTGHGNYRVRSLRGARPVITSRARGAVRSARPVIDWSASGHSRPARPVVLRSASGHRI
jgi:hypothetical protein